MRHAVMQSLEMEAEEECEGFLNRQESGARRTSIAPQEAKSDNSRSYFGAATVFGFLLMIYIAGRTPSHDDNTADATGANYLDVPGEAPVAPVVQLPSGGGEGTPTTLEDDGDELPDQEFRDEGNLTPADDTGRPIVPYSQMATIVPDPEHVPLDQATLDELAEKWGKWHFYDSEELTRPTADLCAQYPPYCDIPGEAFTEEHWQADAVYVNHYLDSGADLVARAMEAIYAEYGYALEQDSVEKANLLAERAKMFHWDKMDMSTATEPPEKFRKRGDRGNGGWTTSRSYDGLVTRLLHACMTSDTFTVVMGGHSAAAGHGNHFHQSYMMQFHKVLAPVLARLGVKLVTKNMGQGGLGTMQNALGAGDLYGDDIDLLLWDSGMTEGAASHIDLFMRQGMLGSKKIPVLWGGNFGVLKELHEHADADVGEFGMGTDGIKEVESVEQAKTLPYASRFMKCAADHQDVCNNEPRFCATCWIDRDGLDPKKLFDSIDPHPKGQVKWHPGWRHHQLVGRVLAFSVLQALQTALEHWTDGVMGGPPLDDAWWHVGDYYNNIREKLVNLDEKVGYCYELAGSLPKRVCNTPMQARSLHTPRNDPHRTSLTTILKPAKDGYVPRNQLQVMYPGPNGHNKCYDIPEGETDVLAIVSARRRLELVDMTPREEYFQGSTQTSREASSTTSTTSTSETPNLRHRQTEEIVPGLGWEVVEEPPGDCDGTYDSICDRARSTTCPALGHHDSRGALVGNEWSGWLVMELPNLSEGIVIIKIQSWMKATDNHRTASWSTVNNERELLEEETERGLSVDELDPETFAFDFAINGEITTWNLEQFKEQDKNIQRVVEMFTLLDKPDFTTEPTTVEVAFRMRGCGTKCTFGLTHVYWA